MRLTKWDYTGCIKRKFTDEKKFSKLTSAQNGAIQVLRNLVHAETNARCPKTGFSAISSGNYGPLGISLQFALVINAKSSFRTYLC